MDKIIVAIGGGEIKNKTTLKIDEYVASLAKARAGERRAVALFFGTASHDSMPYFNSFRKTYTSVFDIKAEVALTVYGEMDLEHIANKIELADCIYIGGGDTLFLIEKWKETGVLPLILQAYEQGKIIAGLSAGAICWFEKMYTDYEIMHGGGEYVIKDGLGVLSGTLSPHFDERVEDFSAAIINHDIKEAFGIENDAALVFKNGEPYKTLSAGGKVYSLKNQDGKVIKTELIL